MSRSLSKGTLGLKFMNRVQPINPAAPPPPADPTPTQETAKSKSTLDLNGKGKGKDESGGKGKGKVVEKGGAEGKGEKVVGSTRPRVIHEGSLLSFPLLASTSTSFTSSSTSSYSSMPLTSTLVSGRRSFGGANVEIEQLNNPSAVPASTSTDKDGKQESNSQKKKRKKSERDEATLDVRAARPSGSSVKAQKWETDADEVKLGGGGGGGGGFAKPKGFEGAKGAVKPSSEMRKKGGGGKEVEPKWGKRGEERAWDAGKGADESEESASEGEGMEVDWDEEEESEGSSESEVEVVKKRSAGGVGGKKVEGDRAKRARLEERERQFKLREEQEVGEGSARKVKKGRK